MVLRLLLWGACLLLLVLRRFDRLFDFVIDGWIYPLRTGAVFGLLFWNMENGRRAGGDNGMPMMEVLVVIERYDTSM